MDSVNLENLFATYQKEIVEDVKVDELSLKDKTMAVPTLKHKWVSRLMVHKVQLRKLKDLKNKGIKTISSQSPVFLSKEALQTAAANDPKLMQIQESIDILETIVEYLEKVEKLLSQLTWDCKNLIDLQKLETT